MKTGNPVQRRVRRAIERDFSEQITQWGYDTDDLSVFTSPPVLRA